MTKTKKKYIMGLFLLVLSTLLFLEITFKISITGFKQGDNVVRTMLFTLSYSVILFILIRTLPRKIFRVFILVMIIFVTFFYFTQDLYYRILSGFFSFTMASDAHMGVAFLSRVFTNLTWVHGLYLLPIGVSIFLFIKSRKIDIPKRFFFYDSFSEFFQITTIAILLFMTVVHTIPKKSDFYLNSPYIYSDYDFYDQVPSAYKTVNKFGMLTYLQRDMVNKFTGKTDQTALFNEIGDYLDGKTPHELNLNSKLFKNKNLILIMAESLDTYAIDPDLSPNLYKMQEESWNFTKYYSPLFFRNTADTEFMSQIGLYTNRNTVLSMESYKENLFPYTLPHLFNEKGYHTYSFHNYTDYFYPRSDFHPKTLGYDDYYGAEELGMLEFQAGVINNHEWQSDLLLMEKALDILLEKDEPFFSYILTVSGHMPYSKRHPIAKTHFETVKQILIDQDRELPIDDILYYHAANYDLDLAIGYLMNKLEEENKADDTVIIIFGDHYAYGLDQEDIADYDDTKDLTTPLEFQRVPMMIYHPDLVAGSKDEIFASIDIMPTIANLFGLDLDYNLVFGKDIFSNQRRSVFFSNGSILTDSFLYDLEAEEYYIYDPEMNKEDVDAFVGEYLYRQRINQAILEIDYYRLKDELEKE